MNYPLEIPERFPEPNVRWDQRGNPLALSRMRHTNLHAIRILRPGRGRRNATVLMQSQPRSCIGSPLCPSSQSSTQRTPSSPTIKLPRRKSPCTTVWRAIPRYVFRRPSQSHVQRRQAQAELIDDLAMRRHVRRSVLTHQKRHSRQVDTMSSREDLTALRRHHRARTRKLLVAHDPLPESLARDVRR